MVQIWPSIDAIVPLCAGVTRIKMLHDYRKKYHDIERAFPLFILHVKYLATRELHYKLRTQISTLYHKKKFVSKKTEAKFLVTLGAFVFTSRRKRQLTGRV